MKKKEIILLTVLIVGLLSGVAVYNYAFNSEHRNIASEEATVTLSAQALFEQFKANETLATTTYLDKVIKIDGKITSIEDKDIVLSNGVQVSFINTGSTQLNTSAQVTIKGRCVGYDELLELVKIDQSTLIK